MSMKREHLIPALVVALAAVALPGTARGQNADPNAKATFVSKIKVKGKKAALRVTYNCASGEALWVSAKESKSGKKRNALTKEGAGKNSAAWWQSHRNKFICDGTSHTKTFTIDKVEPGSKGKLKRGKAWVQFCVTQGEDTLILSKSGWVGVR